MRTLVAVVLVLLSGSAAWGQGKTDKVTLANGDEITGEVEHLSRGQLEFSTDDAGTIQFEWIKVVSVISTRQYEVVASDGRRLLGSLQRSADGFILLVTGDGSVTLEIVEVTSITPIGSSLWKKLDGSIDAGFSYTRSSGIAQTTFNAATTYRRPAFALRFTSSATVTQTNDGDQNDDRGDVAVTYARYRGRRLFIIGGGRFETNESLGLALRSQVGGAIGLRLVNSNRAQFEVAAGIDGNNEQGLDTEATQNVEGLINVLASFYTYDRPKTQLDVSTTFYPSLSDWGRVRLQVDTKVKREIWKDFFLSLTMYDTFDSHPPNPDAQRNDVGVVISAGWSF